MSDPQGWAIHDGPSEKVLYQTCQKLSSLIENYIMEEVRLPCPEI